jgi:CheY-like chemotaxis protein
MEAVGQLAGGVAHDFNNILTAIRGYADLIKGSLPGGSVAASDLDQLVQAADRAATLTRQLLAFGRKTMLEEQVIDPAEVVERIAPMLRRLLGEQIVLSVEGAPGVGHIRADPAQFEQVILNLAVNARDAMPDGGRLRIETSNVELDETFAQEHPGSSTGPKVLLAVTDTGAGMDPETLSHVFEPFFTTKGVGAGTGLGLATVFGIVNMSGASIEVASRPGEGSRFDLYFPRLADVRTGGADSMRGDVALGGPETILLVEDEQPVRRVGKRILESLGYRVLEAGGGDEALALIADGTRVDLLVSDVVMPAMTGPEVRRRLLERRPGLRTVFVSGYPRTGFSILPDADDCDYLVKPYSRESLARTVRAMLDRPA